ncbi:hypothetical protein HPB49_007689 [Dermacentor silvarum]|uniref:Uncharacterized protein n=1 Tax=Dermacentor silvarum TaxID=543639 RepID=A0ACB8D3V7_DERSI|nr:hypothetical protein HPB49_007689 [Dermacentor silvarum]
MADDDASATIGATTPIEKNPQREDNATDLSQKKTLDNGGWFTAKYHNSRLIAVPETGTEAVDKSASSQPKLKGNPLRQEKLPPLPNTDFKVIIRPKNGLNISQLSTHKMARAITKACGNPDMCNKGNLLIRLRNGSNIAIISTPSMETANVVQSVPSLRFGANAVTAYVAAPDNSCKGVIHGLDAGTTPTELLAHLLYTVPRARKQEEPDAEARNAGGRGRTRKRWFSRDSSSTSWSRSRWRTASKTRLAPETQKKQQKKTITKKEEASKQLKEQHCELHLPDNTTKKSCVSTRGLQKVKKSSLIRFNVQKPFENKFPTRSPSKPFGVVSPLPEQTDQNTDEQVSWRPQLSSFKKENAELRAQLAHQSREIAELKQKVQAFLRRDQSPAMLLPVVPPRTRPDVPGSSTAFPSSASFSRATSPTRNPPAKRKPNTENELTSQPVSE